MKNPECRGKTLSGACIWFVLSVSLIFYGWSSDSSVLFAEEPEKVIATDQFSLSDCIGIALENQAAIKAQQAAVGAATEQVNIARSHYYPQVGFQARYTLLDEPRSVDIANPITGQVADVFSDAGAFFGLARAQGSAAALAALDSPTSPPFSTLKQQSLAALPTDPFLGVDLLGENFLTTEFLAVQPLWTGGKIRYRHQQAQLGVRVSQLDVTQAKQATTYNVSRAYLAVLLAGELEDVMSEAAGRSRAIESVVHNLVAGGDLHFTKIDETRTRSIRLLFESERRRAKSGQERAIGALRLAMGLSQDTHVEIADTRLIVHERTIDLPRLRQLALRNRPELQKAGIGVQNAELERRVARADYHPDIALFGRLGTIHDDQDFANPNDSEEWAVGVVVQIPLFTSGRRPAQVRRVIHQQAQAREIRRLLHESVSQQANDAYAEYREMSERYIIMKSAVSNAQETIDLFDGLIRGRLVAEQDLPDHFEDFLVAIRLQTDAQVKYYQVMYGFNLALAKIRKVTASDEYQTSLEVQERRRATAAGDQHMLGR